MTDVNPFIPTDDEFDPAEYPFDPAANPEGYSTPAAIENENKGWLQRAFDKVQRGIDEVATLFVGDLIRDIHLGASEASVTRQYGMSEAELIEWRRQANLNVMGDELGGEDFRWSPIKAFQELIADDPSVFRRGVSPGQLGAQNQRQGDFYDLGDARRMARVAGTDGYNVQSGAIDFALRAGTDVDIAVGKLAKVGRSRLLLKGIGRGRAAKDAAKNLDRFIGSKRFKALDELASKGDKTAVFNALHGISGRADLAELLTVAKTTRERELVVRYLHGDVRAAAEIMQRSKELSRAMSQLTDGAKFISDGVMATAAKAATPPPAAVDEVIGAADEGSVRPGDLSPDEVAEATADARSVRPDDLSGQALEEATGTASVRPADLDPSLFPEKGPGNPNAVPSVRPADLTGEALEEATGSASVRPPDLEGDDLAAAVGQVDDSAASGASAIPERVDPADSVLEEVEIAKDWVDRLEDTMRDPFITRTPTVAGVKRAQSAVTLHNGSKFGAVRHIVSPDWYLSSNLRGGKSPARLINMEDTDQATETIKRIVQRSFLDQGLKRQRIDEFITLGTPEQRQLFLAKLEEEVIQVAAKKNGLSRGDAERLIASWREQSGSVVDALKNRKYDANGRGVAVIKRAGEDIEIPLPLHMTQTANLLPAIDPNDIAKALGRWNRYVGTKEWPALLGKMTTGTDQIWRANILLRPAFLTRVMLLDEGPRVLAKMAAIGKLDEGLLEMGRTGLHNTLVEQVQLKSRLGKKDGFLVKQLKKMGNTKAASVPGFRWTKGELKRPTGFSEAGHQIDGLWGVPGDAAEVLQKQLFQRTGIDSMLGDIEDSVKHGLRSQGFGTLTPASPRYWEQWAHHLNNTLGQDEMIQQLLKAPRVTPATGRKALMEQAKAAGIKGRSKMKTEDLRKAVAAAGDDSFVRAWLLNDPAGQKYLRHFPRKHGGKYDIDMIDEWIAEVREHTDNIIMGRDDLRQLVLSRGAKVDDLKKAIKPEDAPAIHGEMLEAVLRKGITYDAVKDAVATGYQRILALPMNQILKQPLADTIFRAEMEVRIRARMAMKAEAGLPQVLEADELRKVMDTARKVAVNEVGKTLTQLGESGRIVEALSTMLPFIGASVESMSRWAGIIAENPATLGRLRQFWQSPEAANLIRTDDTGNEYLVVPAPEWAQESGFVGADGAFQIRLESMNMILQAPTPGPIMQIPVSAVVRNKPEVVESLDFLFPFGKPVDHTSLLSAWERHVISLTKGTDDRSYAADWFKWWQTEAVKYELGERDTKPTFEEAADAARKIRILKLASSVVGPTTVGWESPYQMHIDTLRRYKERFGFLEGEQRFLDEYGDEYLALTMSVSEGKAGVQPTLKAHELWNRFKDNEVVRNDKDMAALVTGNFSATDEFSPAVYDYQLRESGIEGRQEPMRERPDPDQLKRQYDIDRGWYEKSQLDAMRDVALAEAGVDSFEEIPEVKTQYDAALLKLQQRNPAWADEYDVSDRRRGPKTVAKLRELLTDDEIADLPQMQSVGIFVELYDHYRRLLKKRKANGHPSTLEAAGNAALKADWDTTITALRQDDPAFDQVFSRMLDGVVPSSKE